MASPWESKGGETSDVASPWKSKGGEVCER